MARRFTIQIKDNAVVEAGFPTGGPYVRDGIPPLADGEYELVQAVSGAWCLADAAEVEVLRPVGVQRHTLLRGDAVIGEALERVRLVGAYAAVRDHLPSEGDLETLLKEMARETLAGLRHAIVVKGEGPPG